MAGFKSIPEWVDSLETGRTHLTTFRKQVSTGATAANDFVDYTYFAGNPPANFYASAPLVSATVEEIRGILVPEVSPAKQFLKSITVMSAAASATSVSNQNQRLLLADYLLYYPFIDTDAVGEDQLLENRVTVPRYPQGGLVMAVSQSASSAYGTFTMTYTNQDGVPDRVSQTTYTKILAGGGPLVSSTNAAVTGSQPFIQLQAGDSLVTSIQSVNFTAAGGGLMALVIVKPLLHFYSTQECRRTTSSTLASFGAASQFESLIHHQPVEIKDNAVLGIIGLGNAGSLASSVLNGVLETVWR